MQRSWSEAPPPRPEVLACSQVCGKSPSKRRHRPAFTLIELLVTISIISLLISVLLPSLSRAREISRRTVCGSNLRQLGQSFLHYSHDDVGNWFPAKGKFRDPSAPVEELAKVQHQAAPDWGPNFSGIIRDVVERKHTREGADFPQYLPQTKILLCPSDTGNNPPQSDSPPIWDIAQIQRFEDLPRTRPQEQMLHKSFISYFYVALWRSDDRGDFMIMGDQSDNNDTTVSSFNGLTPEDNHGTRGINILMVDSHVEWARSRSGRFEDVQDLSNRFWGPIIATRPRYPTTEGSNRSSEVQTIE